MVRNNDFIELGRAINKINDFGAGTNGLSFLCNDMDNTTFDIIAFDDVAQSQGFFNGLKWASASNTFHYNSQLNGDISYLFNSAEMDYYYHPDSVREQPLQFTMDSVDDNDSKEESDCNIDSEPNPDDPSFPPKDMTAEVVDKFTDTKTNDDHIKLIIDNGDTDGIILIVDDYSDTDPAYVLTTLANLAPNVSEEVVIAVFDNSQYYTEGEVAQLLMDNPMVLLNDYIGYIVWQSGSFNSTNTHLIQVAFDSHTSPRQTLINRITQGRKEIHAEIRRIMNYVKNEPIDYSFQRSLYGYTFTWLKDVRIVETYIEEADWSNALSALNALSTPRNTVGRSNEINEYKKLKTIQISLLQNGGWQTISSSDFDELITMASGNFGLASNQASLILKNQFDKKITSSGYTDNYAPITFKPSLIMGKKEAEVAVTMTNHTIHIRSEDASKEFSLYLYNITGSKIISQKVTSGTSVHLPETLQTGIYFYQVLDNDQIITSGKVFVNDKE